MLYGDGGGDTILGGDGNDVLFGGIHDDELFGNTGLDRLNGEDGTGEARAATPRGRPEPHGFSHPLPIRLQRILAKETHMGTNTTENPTTPDLRKKAMPVVVVAVLAVAAVVGLDLFGSDAPECAPWEDPHPYRTSDSQL